MLIRRLMAILASAVVPNASNDLRAHRGGAPRPGGRFRGMPGSRRLQRGGAFAARARGYGIGLAGGIIPMTGGKIP